MKNITDIDTNFKVRAIDKKNNLEFYDVLSAPFRLYGIEYSKKSFRRIPEEIAKKTNEGVLWLHSNTAGGRIRFVTDSDTVALRVKYNPDRIGRMQHFALTGSVGFDMYCDDIFKGTFFPGYDIKNSLEAQLTPGAGKKTVTINMPLYSTVTQVLVGVKSGSLLQAAEDYAVEKPVVYYGSSITQGGCASRPGNSYQAILTRRLNVNHINLGFSGNAKGERVMADYIASLDMSAFVLDYDHNAPTAEHLEATHEKFFKVIREAHPELPILMLTRPVPHLNEDEVRREEIVRRTYENALAAGDKNVYFIPGRYLVGGDVAECATVDGCHPNDSGFLSMALVIEPVLRTMLGLN